MIEDSMAGFTQPFIKWKYNMAYIILSLPHQFVESKFV